MAKRKAAPETTTDFSWANEYLEERRTGKLRRIQVKFPLSTDRKEGGNIPYADQALHREWRGKAPLVGRPNDEKSIKGAYSLDDAEFIHINDAPNINNVPDGYIATPSGIEPLADLPFTEGEQQGYATNPPVEINSEFANDSGSGIYYIGMNINTENMRGERYPYRYYTQNPAADDIRMSWRLSNGFDNPTAPALRYPKKGAVRLKKHTM